MKALIKTFGKNTCRECGGELERLKHCRHITEADNETFMDHSTIKDGYEFTYYYKCKECGKEFSFDQIVNGEE